MGFSNDWAAPSWNLRVPVVHRVREDASQIRPTTLKLKRQAHMTQWVVFLSAPRDIRHEDGRYNGSTDLNAVRLKETLRQAVTRGLPILASMKSTDQSIFHRDLERLSRDRRLRVPRERIEIMTGAHHTLDNAWYVLQFAHRNGVAKLVIVTSAWHMPRVRAVFQGMEETIGRVTGNRVELEFVNAPFSNRRQVRRYEQHVLVYRELRINDAARVYQYARALSGWDLEEGFPPRPDELCPGFVAPPDVFLLSQLEREARV